MNISNLQVHLLEKDEKFNISSLMDEITTGYNNNNIISKIQPEIYLNGRKNLIKRCVNNLIDNSIKYANKVSVELSEKNKNIFIKFEDDGPGIPEKEYENVFKPFYKIDKGESRLQI